MVAINIKQGFVEVDFGGQRKALEWNVRKYVGQKAQIIPVRTPAVYTVQSGKAYYSGLAWAICRLGEPLDEFVQSAADLSRIRVVKRLDAGDRPWAKDTGVGLDIYVPREEAHSWNGTSTSSAELPVDYGCTTGG